MQSSAVALVLAPASESTLRSLAAGTTAWIASTPEMQPTIAAAKRAGLLVTELHPHGSSPAQWLVNHLDSVDQHHNEFSQNPGYTELLVFGVPMSPSLTPLLQEFGFVSSSAESFGFCASKSPST
jgi:hypothetical protein